MNATGKLRLLNPQPFEGECIELIIGIDIGTTFSGVCYAFLRPGEVPQVQSVTRFTDQVNGDEKVPSTIYYDEDHVLRAAGATAALEDVADNTEFENWVKVQYFKMHMRPQGMEINMNGLTLDDLPHWKTATEVTADFLRYLYRETIKFIEIHHTDGKELTKKVSDRTSFVLSHPNGWDGLPQQRMREAAIIGGLIQDSLAGRKKIRFVSEGEASALSCLAGGLCPSDLKPGYRFVIADAGGGTLDMTSYEVTRTSPLRLRELTSSDCRFAGSLFVNMEARKLLQRKLQGSHLDNTDILDEVIGDAFEHRTKREFSDSSKAYWLRVGDRNENDAGCGIRRGSLRLEGAELASCFQFSVDEALKSIRAQISACGGGAMPIWLVGGFAASGWLFKRLDEELRRDGIDVSRPDINQSKAVAHGNVLFSFESTVTSRVTRCTYGIVCRTHYYPFISDHYRRRHLKFENLEGETLLPGKFDTIVHRNIEVNETKEFTCHYTRLIQKLHRAKVSVDIRTFDDEAPAPEWYDENKDKFRKVCTITADLSRLCRPAALKMHNGETFWKLEYEVEIFLGLTELDARLKWVEDGETKYGPTTIFHED